MSSPLRVALLTRAAAPEAVALAEALARAGQLPSLIAPEPGAAGAGIGTRPLQNLAGRLLRSRGIGDGLDRLPHDLLELTRARFDLAHAFSPMDALAALAWSRRSRSPVVLTFTEPLRRETIANRRLKLATLERAVNGADAVVAATDEVQRSLRRLLALDAPVVPAFDTGGYLSLYRELCAS